MQEAAGVAASAQAAVQEASTADGGDAMGVDDCVDELRNALRLSPQEGQPEAVSRTLRKQEEHAYVEIPPGINPPPSYEEALNHPSPSAVQGKSESVYPPTILAQPSPKSSAGGNSPAAVSAGAFNAPRKSPPMLQDAPRSISMVKPDVAANIRRQVNQDRIIQGSSCSWMDEKLTSVFNTLVLPDFSSFSPAIRSYLYWQLLDVDVRGQSRLERLQNSGAINTLPRSEWLAVDKDSQIINIEPPRGNQGSPGQHTYAALLPLRVLGDGNCLLHACSVALWGIQDRLQTLRIALYKLLREQTPTFFKRWKEQEMAWDWEDAQAMGLDSSIERSPEEWNRDFQENIDRARDDGAFLSQIHIYVLAHVLRRPIVVYAPAVQQESPCRMRGIYLPLDWIPGRTALETAPLLLAYEASHFVPLVYHQGKAASAWPLIPLATTDPGGSMTEPLPLLFTEASSDRDEKRRLCNYVRDPMAALSDFLPVEQVESEEGVQAACSVEVGVRIDIEDLQKRALRRLGGGGGMEEGSKAGGEGMAGQTEHMVQGWLHHLRKQALEATAPSSSNASTSSFGRFVRQDSDVGRALAGMQPSHWDKTLSVYSASRGQRESSARRRFEA